ncbi:hypothetical protein AWC17_05490 [Mycobacterium nebraskense]|uniref:DUF2505 domain-containing protein n=1 Tax=Mycobacterium nebraskense TaxID=244292 RepID=A0A0F5NHN6_9MYCO|nr:DUF2505 domain-containing protein [Mycobacterium nebraskense]KKC06591.1 hypothetical protein WU83_02050 [Mycobacterium nebraskense]KLO34020.1 hypothetical protein ABW17_27170 [Mycobacterium nebraskense]MCV7116794.1 DUF2505 domain-containing protein [Mycobacterium nebraskense]ORW22106.1 hypothetical protein AWC17_05490 [Mycobacterium nebraskense]
MSRSFDILIESPATVEQIHTTFGREDYWLARLKASNAPTTLDSLVVDPDGTVTMRATQYVARQILPTLIAKAVPGELKIVHSETWQPADDGEVRGQIRVVTSGGVGSGLAEAWMAPTGNGARLRFAVQVAVKIPLVGRKLEKSMEADLAESIPALQRFTSTWIAENP